MTSSISKFDTIIIGAGNAGLVAALTLAKSGQRTLLLERHNIPGGCATSFVRGRFEFEVSLHQLSGIGTLEKPGLLRGIFEELGVMDDLELVYEDELYRVVCPGEVDVTLPASRTGAISTLKAAFPLEAGSIDTFFELVYRVTEQSGVVPALAKNRISENDAREHYPDFIQYGQKSVAEVFDMIGCSPQLAHALGAYWSYIGVPPSKMQFANFAVLLWSYLEYKPVHVQGGSQAISASLLKRYLALGGEARFNCAAKRIVLENGCVAGVLSECGERFLADNVVSNASLPVTYYQLIGEENVPPGAVQDQSSRSVGPSAFTIHMGLDCPPEALGIHASTTFITGTIQDDLSYHRARSMDAPLYACMSCYNVANPGYSPKGSCHIALLALQYSDPWEDMAPETYFDEKYAYAEKLLNLAERVHPGLRDAIEEVDVATPLTHMRYLGHPGGAIYGFDQTVTDNALLRPKHRFIAGLHLAGSWAGAGGYEPTLSAGASAARSILRSTSTLGA